MLAHERRGSGPPLVLIHGLGSRRQVWDPLIAELARHREVIAVDLPGFGESPLWPPLDDPRQPHRAGRPSRATAGPTTPGPTTPGPTTPGPTTPGPTTPGNATPGNATPSNATPGDATPSNATPGNATLGPPTPGPTTLSPLTPDPATPGFTDNPAADDPRGFEAAPVPGSVGHLADVVATFLDGLGLDRPELAGSSLGGGIALELGRRGRASAVTAFAPIGFWGPVGRRWCQAVVGGARVLGSALAPALPRIFATRAGRVALCGIFYGHPSRLSPEDCLGSARALSHAPGFAAARRAFGVWRLPVGADPGALTGIPVTIAWGTRDLVLPHHRQAARAREELPTARHVLLPGCGHLPFADDPARCAELLTVRQ
ncbi:alpha/beta fold hydrolase [Actinoplanes sp. NPDC048791]|uniref:alpha/beta fold hydrolase n=1 Tax=Actinoplanes sp. NPDC048791 TaxID=3154623 RepID=UPI0033EB1A22